MFFLALGTPDLQTHPPCSSPPGGSRFAEGGEVARKGEFDELRRECRAAEGNGNPMVSTWENQNMQNINGAFLQSKQLRAVKTTGEDFADYNPWIGYQKCRPSDLDLLCADFPVEIRPGRHGKSLVPWKETSGQ